VRLCARIPGNTYTDRAKSLVEVDSAKGRDRQLLIGLLEDDLAIQEMLRLLLRGEGYEVTIYASANDCLADVRVDELQAGFVQPDLLLIDLHLAKSISGTAVIEQIRANPRLESLPIILMTASTSLNEQDLSHLQATLLIKPFDIDEIIKLVNELSDGAKI
jgi:CheY-like chemotaxis protein